MLPMRSSTACTILKRLEKTRPQGFDALVARLVRIQSALAAVLSRHTDEPIIGDVVERGLRANSYARVALEYALGSGRDETKSMAADAWLARMLRVVDDPLRATAHGITPYLHDLGLDNHARRLACRFVPPVVLGPPSPVQGITVEALLSLSLSDPELARIVDEVERVVALQTDLCREVHEQFVA